MSNQAKDWQEGEYTIRVKGNSVQVSKICKDVIHGVICYKQKSAHSRCDPQNEFDLVEGVTIAMKRLKQYITPRIVEGDMVKIKNDDYIYSNYDAWVTEQLFNGLEPGYAIRFRYNDYEPDLQCKYKVIKIAPHLDGPDYNLVLIESDTPTKRCYVISLRGLEKC